MRLVLGRNSGSNGYCPEAAEKRNTERKKRAPGAKTITLDNGGDFAMHALVSKAINADIYFAKPYASYQRGTNENTNGIIRRQWPKKMLDSEPPYSEGHRAAIAGLTIAEIYQEIHQLPCERVFDFRRRIALQCVQYVIHPGHTSKRPAGMEDD